MFKSLLLLPILFLGGCYATVSTPAVYSTAPVYSNPYYYGTGYRPHYNKPYRGYNCRWYNGRRYCK